MNSARVRLGLSILLAGVIVAGCGDDGSTDPDGGMDAGFDAGGGPPGLGEPPALFGATNVLVEVFVGAWGGFSPDAYVYLDAIRGTHPGRVRSVSLHNGDALSSADGDARTLFYGVSAYPHGVVDGDAPSVSRGEWSALVDSQLMRIPRCGLAIDATVTTAIEVQVACDAIVTAETRLNIWAVEAAVTGPDQTSYYDATAGHPYFGAGNPIVDFEHENVLRGFLTTGTQGETVDVTAGKVTDVVDGSVACLDTDCMIVAFLTVYDAASGEHHVEATESVEYGDILPW